MKHKTRFMCILIMLDQIDQELLTYSFGIVFYSSRKIVCPNMSSFGMFHLMRSHLSNDFQLIQKINSIAELLQPNYFNFYLLK